MTVLDGTIIGVTQIVDHGSASQRFNLVLVSEGYREVELTQFAKDAQSFADTLFTTSPFDGFQKAFNIYRIDVGSTESGADNPAVCTGAAAVVRATYFDAHFYVKNRCDVIDVDVDSVRTVVGALVPNWHAIIVIVNSPIGAGFGHTGARVGIHTNRPPTAAGLSWESVAIHELGHAAFGLWDEYAGSGTFTDPEPDVANATTNANLVTIKWRDLIGAIPGLEVGAFEGTGTYNYGLYRGVFTCVMKVVPESFCIVCQRRIETTLAPHLPNRFVRPPMRSRFRRWSSPAARPPFPRP